MTEIFFYHLTSKTADQFLPELLEKVMARSGRAIVRLASEARAEGLAQSLWNYDAKGFLPHGNAKDGMAEHQPIWITHQDENPNGAKFLFLLDGASVADFSGCERVSDLVDGYDAGAVERAKTQCAEYRKSGHNVSYWQQGDKGWVKT